MIFNPPFPLLPLAGPMLVLASLGALWLSFRASHGLGNATRASLLALRILSVIILCLLFLNPGKWDQPEETSTRSLVVLADRSASMATPDEFSKARWSSAVQLAELAVSAALKVGYQSVAGAFSDSFEPIDTSSDKSWKSLQPNGSHSAIPAAIDAALAAESSRGRTPTALILLSDGRLTGNPPDMDTTVARARAFGIPIHTVALGGSWKMKDLKITCPRRQVLAYPGRPLKVPVTVDANGLGPIAPELQLLAPDGNVLTSTTIRLAEDGRESATFTIDAPPEGGTFTVSSPALPGEELTTNNSDTLRIRLLTGKTRVFIAEGAPYWDSKFLAQLLRQVPFMEVDSVHRLSDERFFFLAADGQTNDTSRNTGSLPVFPSTPDAISRYDLIVFGKACEHFLTPERMALLTSFVRDQGGAVLFARGKPYSRDLPGIDLLEPVQWGSAPIAEFRFTPSSDGEATALFGEALPAADDRVWSALPALQDARETQAIKPFSRVLAHGIPCIANGVGATPVPALVVRRFGLGVTGLLNGDGLWKWDFYPEARQLGNMYEEFWTQLIQWMASYSEFLPGQDFSLRLSSSSVLPNDVVTIQSGWRGSGPTPEPRVEITIGDEVVNTIIPTLQASDDGRPRWQATLRAPSPGEYRARLVLPNTGSSETALPEVPLSVARPPGELDNLDANPDYLAALSKATGGTSTRADGLLTILDGLKIAENSSTKRPPVFTPLWPVAPLFLFLALLFAADWTIRRRNGHA